MTRGPITRLVAKQGTGPMVEPVAGLATGLATGSITERATRSVVEFDHQSNPITNLATDPTCAG